MPHFARPLLAAGIAALAVPLSAGDCMTCGDIEAGGSLGMLDGYADDAGESLQIDVRAGFNFHRTSVSGDRVLEAPRGALPGEGAAGAPGLVGYVTLRGDPGRFVYVDLPGSITLHGPGGDTILVGAISSDLPRPARLDDEGRLDFAFSGTLAVPAMPGAGDYVADFAISADYE